MSAVFRASDLANANVAAMHGYVPGQQPQDEGWVKLNTNENPYAPSPKVAEAIIAELADGAAKLRLYPNPTSAPLRAAVAEHHAVSASQVLLGNGADDVLNLLIRVFAKPTGQCGATGAASGDSSAVTANAVGGAGMAVPSYSLYSTLTEIQGAHMEQVGFDAAMQLPVDAIVNSGARLFLLTNPNAPTGVAFTPEQVEGLLKRFSGILVLDETYAPFADADAVGLLGRYPNLVIVRSFSKAYALAGMRLGYALASADIIDLLDRVRDSYNLDRLAQAAGLAAINDQPYYTARIEQIKQSRQAAEDDYDRRGWFTYPSEANFHFTRPQRLDGLYGPEVARRCFEFLKKERVLVRAFPGHALTRDFLRISVGSEAEMERLAQVLDAWQQAEAA